MCVPDYSHYKNMKAPSRSFSSDTAFPKSCWFQGKASLMQFQHRFAHRKNYPQPLIQKSWTGFFFNKKRTIFFLIFIQGRTFCHGTFEVFLLGGIQQQWNLGMYLDYPHLLVFYSNNLSSKCCLSILHIFNFFFHRNKIRDGINVVCFLKL